MYSHVTMNEALMEGSVSRQRVQQTWREGHKTARHPQQKGSGPRDREDSHYH